MEIYDYWLIIRARLWVLAAVVLVSVGVAGTVSVLTTPQYSARATVYFASPEGRGNRDLSRGLLYAQAVVRSYAEAAEQPLVLDPVIRQLGLGTTAEALARTVDVESPLGTVIVQVRATDPSPRRAAAVADAVANQLATASTTLTPTSASPDTAPVRVSTVASAAVPRTPSTPRTRLNLALALLLGTLVGAVLCIWLDAVRPRVATRLDVLRMTEVPLLGYLPAPARRRPWRRAPDRETQRTLLAQLYVNFRSVQEDHGLRTVLFVSADGGTQPERAARAMALALNRNGARVIVVDADLRAGRRPGLSWRADLRVRPHPSDPAADADDVAPPAHANPATLGRGMSLRALSRPAPSPTARHGAELPWLTDLLPDPDDGTAPDRPAARVAPVPAPEPVARPPAARTGPRTGPRTVGPVTAGFSALSGATAVGREVPEGPGLTAVLRRGIPWRAVARQRPGEPALLSSGPGLQDPGSALDSPPMADLLAELGAEYDLVLLHGAPVLHVGDALALSGLMDGVLVVGSRRAMPRATLQDALTALQRVRAPLRGIVLSG